jgi:hypothetical protein
MRCSSLSLLKDESSSSSHRGIYGV